MMSCMGARISCLFTDWMVGLVFVLLCAFCTAACVRILYIANVDIACHCFFLITHI